MKRHSIYATLAAAALCGTAYAQPAEPSPTGSQGDHQSGEPATKEGTDDAPINDGDLPQPVSDNDPQPEVAAPGVPPGGFVEQAGVGGLTGYGRAGVLELGGSAGFTAAGDLTQVNVAPSIGWFVADNLELTGIIDLAYAATEMEDATLITALVEPSYHLPFNRTTFAFLGLGAGVSYVSDTGAGFAMAPRVGGNFLIGRSGILTPSLSYQYTTHDSADTGNGVLLQVSSAVRANIGYTIMW